MKVSPLRKRPRRAANAMAWTLTLPVAAWCAGVCLVAIQPTALGATLALILAGFWIALDRLVRSSPFRSAILLGATLVVAAAVSLGVRPRADRDWAFEMERTPHAEVAGEFVTLHNFRDFDWRSAGDAEARWETRTFTLSNLSGVDLVMVYWGSPHMSHTMASFDFGREGRVCISIEARREQDEKYSPTRGALRRYELLYVIGAERDLIRLRTNFRANQTVRLFRLQVDAAAARRQFLGILAAANAVHTTPAWYHTVTRNCTTEILQHDLLLRPDDPRDWRLIANGHLDEYLQERGYVDRTLPLAVLRARSDITERGRTAPEAEFSSRVRAAQSTP